LTDLHELSDMTTDDYVLTTIELECNKKYINAKYMWSQNYQKVSDFISLNNEIRLYDIPRDSFKRNIYLEDFVEVGLTDKGNDSIVSSDGLACFMNTFSNSPNPSANKPIRLFAFNSESTVEFDRYDNETNTLIKPITSYAGGNSLNFHVEFDNSTIVGSQLDIEVEGLEPPLNQPIIYTDDIGIVYDFEFRFVNDIDPVDSEDLPIVDKLDLLFPLVIAPPYRIHKDTREVFALTYALHVIPEEDLENKIIIGKYLVERNNLLKSIVTDTNQFEVFGTNTPYTLADNRFSRSTDTVVAQTHSISGRRLMLSGTVAFSTWGIRKQNTKELVLAVNQGVTPITTLWFNFKDKQTGVIYPSETSQPSFLVNRPTQISLIPPSNNPTDTTIAIVWVDGNLSPTATSFEFGISDDFVNWTSETVSPQVTNAKTFTGLLPNTKYLIRIRAFINDDFSEYAYFEATTTAPAPNTPTNLTLTLTDERSISVEWDEADDDVFLYRIQASESNDFSTFIEGGLKTTYFDDTRITYNFLNADIDYDTEYFFRVRALRDGLFSAFTPTESITTSTIEVTSPPVITNLKVSFNQITFTLINTDDQLVTLFADLSTGETQQATGVRPNEAETFTLTAVNPNNSVLAKAQAVNKAVSPIVTLPFTATEAPATANLPSDALTQTVNNHVRVDWTYSGPIVASFVLERNPNAALANEFGAIVSGIAANSRTQTDFFAPSSTTLEYRIRAVNQFDTTISNTRSITTGTFAPATPSDLSSSVVLDGIGNAAVTLSWQRNSTDESLFYIYRGNLLAGTQTRGTTNFTDFVLEDETFVYTVSAGNENGISAKSTGLTVNT